VIGYVSRSVRFDPELYDLLRKVAFDQERSINSCVVEAVAKWLRLQQPDKNESPH
jgi:hypothetical protein